LQAIDWKLKQPIQDAVLKQQMQVLTKAGARHVGYYPDDFLKNQPEMEAVRPYVSARNFPYLAK
jgi:biofilm PGA synthesis lipoprotein PgaB